MNKDLFNSVMGLFIILTGVLAVINFTVGNIQAGIAWVNSLLWSGAYLISKNDKQ